MMEMECDDCGAAVEIDLVDYLKHKEEQGTLLCYSCKHSVLRRVTRPDVHAATA